MQRDSVISLRPPLGIWRGLRDPAGTDPDAVYGCVDWYLYHETLAGCAPHSPRAEPSRRIEPAPPGDGAGTDTGVRPSA